MMVRDGRMVSCGGLDAGPALIIEPLRRYRLRGGLIVQVIRKVDRPAKHGGPYWEAFDDHHRRMTFDLDGRSSPAGDSPLDILRRER